MRVFLGALLVTGVLAGAAHAAEPSKPAEPSRPATQDAAGVWRDVKERVRAGAYREALQGLALLERMAPGDPWVAVYRTLCEQRLKAASALGQLSTEVFIELRGRLKEEELRQRRQAGQRRTVERAVRGERAAWDRQLAEHAEEAKRQERHGRQRAQAEAIEQARAERRRKVAERTLAREAAVEQARRQLAQAPRPSAGPARAPAATPPPAAPGPEAPVAPAPKRGAVEIAPVIVPTTRPGAAPPAAPPGVTPPPPGAVRIDARQMHVSPDRKVAVAEGSVEIAYGSALLTCDQATFFTDTHDAYAEGRVRIEDGDQIYHGDMIHYNFDTKKGRFLQAVAGEAPWYLHGRSIESIAEGVYRATPGAFTSCDHDPPHFTFAGRQATIFTDDRIAKARNVAVMVEKAPVFYLPWFVAADRQSPFFLIPGKRKPWGQYALSGYRYEWPVGEVSQKGSLRLDWRRHFGWAVGVDHLISSASLGQGLLKLYYNEEQNRTERREALPKGADVNRYRALWRHTWEPREGTTVLTDIQEFSDVNFRKDLLFNDEFVSDNQPESFVSVVSNAQDYTLTGLVRKRMNRFDAVTEAFPDLALNVRSQRIGETRLYSETSASFANLESKTAHSESDTDVVRAGWFQQFRYALGLLQPVEVTPRFGFRQTYHTKDVQGGAERNDGERDVLSHQVSTGVDASVKFFRVFPVTVRALGLDLNWLRHVVTPTLSYEYVHRPTVAGSLLSFSTDASPTNRITFGLEHKLQTRRVAGAGRRASVELARLLISLPYTFHGTGNKAGGELGDWAFDVELQPWPWLRLESDWSVPSHFAKRTRDSRITAWNVDVALVNPATQGRARLGAPEQLLERPDPLAVPEPQLEMPPAGHWAAGLTHRYSHNDKTSDVLYWEWAPSAKWHLETTNTFIFKEVVGDLKRFGRLRGWQYVLRRDLHDWIGQVVYRVDREFGEELLFTLTLKAYPELPIELQETYHQPKIGSQSDPFHPQRVVSSTPSG